MRIYQSHDGDEDWIVELDHQLAFLAITVGESGTQLWMALPSMERYEALTADEQLELIEGITAELQCMEPDTELSDIHLEYEPFAEPPEWLWCDNAQLDEIILHTPSWTVYQLVAFANGGGVLSGPKRYLEAAMEFYRQKRLEKD